MYGSYHKANTNQVLLLKPKIVLGKYTPVLWGVIFIPPKELWEPYIVIALSIRPALCPLLYPILFEAGIPNLVCGCIMGWLSVSYHFRVTVTLTSDLVFRIFMSYAYLILFEEGIPNLICAYILGWQSVRYHPWVTVTLILPSDLVSRMGIESGAYLLYFLR